MKKQAVLSLSGGMDSSTLLLHLLANHYQVTCLSFDYGQKHKVELERATQLVEYINTKLVFPVKHQIIKLDGLTSLLNSALVEGGKDVPEGHYEQDNMKETVVPNRNKIFSSIVQAVALSIATRTDELDNMIYEDVKIALGIHAGDHAIYPDCRQEFRDIDFEAFKVGNWDSNRVSVYTPYLEVNKFDILKDGELACQKLGLNFDEVYKRTNTSYKPIQIWNEEGKGQLHTTGLNTGKYHEWYSDYKSAASVERIEAFIKLGRPDPVAYADETGPVTWWIAKAHVEKVLAEHKS
jgi:7-cyano-7-deazaguanine synthase